MLSPEKGVSMSKCQIHKQARLPHTLSFESVCQNARVLSKYVGAEIREPGGQQRHARL